MKLHLTPREEEIMTILWRLQKAFVKEIIAEMPDPKPPYNTVSSIVRKLESEGLIGHNAFGNTHQYYPVLQKSQYRKWSFRRLFERYFEGSPEALMSHFIKEEKVDPAEINSILKKLKK